ncbi:DUF3891 family protein [Hymenobacter sp. BRD67]|nr:DUF3891 family protein [Hymenobacter sp. BRD67]
MNPLPTGWQVIYQQAHALLAAQLAWAWPAFLPADRWVGMLAAIMQHDDEQEAWHGRGGHHGLTPAGAPANFTQVAFSRKQATGVLHAARFQGRWRSLLTSLHLSTLYEPLRVATPILRRFWMSCAPARAAGSKSCTSLKPRLAKPTTCCTGATACRLFSAARSCPRWGASWKYTAPRWPLGGRRTMCASPLGRAPR